VCEIKNQFSSIPPPSIILKLCSFPSHGLSNSRSLRYFYGRPFPHFHPPFSPLSFHNYNQPTISFFSSYPPIWYYYCQNSSHSSEQCTLIEYSLDYVKINLTHFKDLRMNLIHQTSIWKVGVVLNFHRINHIKILNQIGPTLNQHFHLGDLTMSMRN